MTNFSRYLFNVDDRLENTFFSRLSGYYLFLAALIEYEQVSNPSDRCHRWSSYRNQSWLLSWLLSDDEKEAFLSSMISAFLESVYSDISDMTSRESGVPSFRCVLASLQECPSIDRFVRPSVDSPEMALRRTETHLYRT